MVIPITCIEDIISSFPSAIKKKYDLLQKWEGTTPNLFPAFLNLFH